MLPAAYTLTQGWGREPYMDFLAWATLPLKRGNYFLCKRSPGPPLRGYVALLGSGGLLPVQSRTVYIMHDDGITLYA